MGILESVRERLETYGSTHLGPVCTMQELEWILAEHERVRAEVARLTAMVPTVPCDRCGQVAEVCEVEAPGFAYGNATCCSCIALAYEQDCARLTAEVEARPAIGTLPTEFACGEWIMSGECEPDAVVTYASEPSPETGHVGWCWWARGQMGDASDYMAARAAAERALRAHAKEPKR